MSVSMAGAFCLWSGPSVCLCVCVCFCVCVCVLCVKEKEERSIFRITQRIVPDAVVVAMS